MTRRYVAERQDDGESSQAGLEDLGGPLAVGSLLVGGVQHALAAAVGQQPGSAVVFERLDLGREERRELGGVRPAVPLHDHGRAGLVPPYDGDPGHRKVSLLTHAVLASHGVAGVLEAYGSRFVGQEHVAVAELART